MSTLPDNEFDLEKLFLPAWAQEEPSSTKYAKYEGREERPERRGERRGPRPSRREGQPGREGNRPRGDRRAGPSSDGRSATPGNRERGPRPGSYRGGPPERREPPPPLPEINLILVPEEKGVESLARQIKMTGRAYPLFDIALMILQKPERHSVVFSVKKNAEGKPVQQLFRCALDETVWLSEDEAVGHVLKKHFSTFYQAERTATEPPKGKYTFVAQCGMSGAILGPPNYHDYQNQLHKLHSERFSRMPFEVYKARVKIVRDEEVVKKWVDDQSWKTEYLCLNMPEPLRLSSMEAVEKHFRENHKDNIIKPVESHTLGGAAARSLRSPDLVRLVRSVSEDQRRFPLQIATILSQQFATHGLQFFKVNKTITHVSVARPHYLDLALIPVSEGVKRIVDFINANPKCTRRKLVEALAPSPAAATQLPIADGQPAPQTENTVPTSEQNSVSADLHWLIHQGHVIEFANGTLETAKKPVPRPAKPEPKSAPKPPELTESATQTTLSELSEVETSPSTAPIPVQAAPPAEGATPEAELRTSIDPQRSEPEMGPQAGEPVGTEPAASGAAPVDATPSVLEKSPEENPPTPVESRT